MTLRRLACAALLMGGVAGCAGVPAAVAWTTVGAVAGATGSVFAFDTELLKVWAERHPPTPAAQKP